MNEIITSLISGVYQLGVAIGVGASTVSLTFLLIALSDDKVTAHEKSITHVVNRILTWAMIITAVALLFSLFLHTTARDLQYAIQWAFLGVLFMNGILMRHQKTPPLFTPVLQGATWYALLLITVLPVMFLSDVIIALVYIGWVAVVYLTIRAIVRAIHDGARD